MKSNVFIFSYQTLLAKFFLQRVENGIDMEVTQEEERIGPKLHDTCAEICIFID